MSHLLDASKLEYTINSLKKNGVKEILLLGPICQWKDNLPNLLIKYYKKSIIKKIPSRLGNLSVYCPDACEAVDHKLSEIAKKTNIRYISLRHILCNKDGCLVKSGETVETLVQFDVGHLTTAGSEYVVSRIFQKNLS